MLKTKVSSRAQPLEKQANGHLFGPSTNAAPDSSTGGPIGTISTERRRAPSSRPGRSLSQRLSRGHVFGLVLGVIGFTMTWLLLDGRDETVEILVASEDVPAGATVETAGLRPVEVPVGSPLATRGIQDATAEYFATETLRAGDPILQSSISESPVADGLIEIEVEVSSLNAQLEVGDRVAVIGVVSQGSTASSGWLAVDARIVALSDDEPTGGLIIPSGETAVTIAVTDSQALALAGAQEVGQLTIVEAGFDIESIDVEERLIVTAESVGRQVPPSVEASRSVQTPAPPSAPDSAAPGGEAVDPSQEASPDGARSTEPDAGNGGGNTDDDPAVEGERGAPAEPEPGDGSNSDQGGDR